jgi:hypothetical protein
MAARSLSMLIMVAVAMTQGLAAQATVVSLRFVAPGPNITLYEPVALHAVFENASSTPVSVDIGANYVGNFKLSLQTPDGKILTADPGHPGGEFGFRRGQLDVPPGQSRAQDILLSRWFEFGTPGTYRIGVDFVGSPELNLRRQQQVVFTILPPDERALQATCERLMTIARTGRDWEEIVKAAQYLASVKNPVAVPYLVRLVEPGKTIEQPLVEEIGIIALERLGAYDSLRQLMESADFERRLQIDRALQRMERAQRSR